MTVGEYAELSEDGRIHEKCGVFGIYAEKDQSVAEDIRCALTALQHRGQESAGISVSDTEGPKGNLLTRKGMGLVSEVFGRCARPALPGTTRCGNAKSRCS